MMQASLFEVGEFSQVKKDSNEKRRSSGRFVLRFPASPGLF